MGKAFSSFVLWMMCLYSTQVLANSESSALEPRQGFTGLPFASPYYAGLYPSLDLLALYGQNNLPLLQQQLQLQQLPYAAGLQGVGDLTGFPGLQGLNGFQGLNGLQGLSGLQGFNGLQGLNGQGLQDPQEYQRRFGALGLGNRIRRPSVGLRPTLGLRSPFLGGGVGSVNPALGRGVGGQESLSDLLRLAQLLGVDGTNDNLSQTHQQTPSFTSRYSTQPEHHQHSFNTEDKELIALLQSFSTNNRQLALATASALPLGAGVPRLSPLSRPGLGRGGPIFPGFLNSGLRHRSGLDSDNAPAASNRVGIPGAPTPDVLQYFQQFPETSLSAHHRLQDVETDSDLQFRFPNSG